MSVFIKIRLVGTELFHADRQTDGSETERLIVTFRNFAKAPRIHAFMKKIIRRPYISLQWFFRNYSFRISNLVIGCQEWTSSPCSVNHYPQANYIILLCNNPQSPLSTLFIKLVTF